MFERLNQTQAAFALSVAQDLLYHGGGQEACGWVDAYRKAVSFWSSAYVFFASACCDRRDMDANVWGKCANL